MIPATARVIAVGLAPGVVEERVKIPFQGPSGELLRTVLREEGLDPEREVGYANLTRCRPSDDAPEFRLSRNGDIIHDVFESPAWQVAARRCATFLTQDVGRWSGPLLLLGSRPLQRFSGSSKASVRRERGLWKRLPDGRDAFVALHPAGILRAGDQGTPERDRLEAQFRRDLRRMADRVLGREKFPEVKVYAYRLSDPKASVVLRRIAARLEPWIFDIETEDANGSPARSGVATDPFHPDFRVRGAAIALDGGTGVWFEFDVGPEVAKPLLAPVFSSEAEKGAFVSGFDANGLIAQGWVAEVRNLTQDPWLAAIALDTVGGGHSLERLVVEVLGESQPKAGVDRARIRDMSLEAVAEYAVRDACAEWRLSAALQDRLSRGAYL